ncbi:MAG: efflux RND transporter periplasmic adaptor subunit [Dysgonamonadaceae bacterium]|jgi:RND family efflux transporter MFP subunit|nr:efflux RND transporter periplasmic adaptor subunit [Dysgonamonadaceae bacterium]
MKQSCLTNTQEHENGYSFTRQLVNPFTRQLANSSTRYLSLLFLLLLLTACHTEQAANRHDEENEENAHLPGAVHFSRQQQEKIPFTIAPPMVEPLGELIRTTARIESSQADEAIISARVPGIVFFSGTHLTEGRNVAAGQTLFSVSGKGLTAYDSGVRLAEAKANYAKVKADYARAQELIREKIISEKDFMQTKTDYETAKAVFDNLSRNFTQGGQQISAPFAGYLKQLLVENGQFVEEGQALAIVSKNKTLLLIADVPSRHAKLLPLLSTATIRGEGKTMYSLEELNGKILSFGKSLNKDNRLIPVSLQIDNRTGLLPGAFVEIFLKTQTGNPVTTIPVSALIEEQGLFFVYVQLDPESFEKREVTLGATDGIRVEIRSGLDNNERIITQGAMAVKLAQSAGTLNTHEH